MSLMKIVKDRMHDLKNIRQNSVVRSKTKYGFGESAREDESIPAYDVKVVDKKITELQNWVYVADAKIKQANAATQVDMILDVENLLKPLD